MADVDTTPEAVKRLADDLQDIRWPADQGSKLREDAAHTLRALLAAVTLGEETAKANARLIAAAPDLLAALREVEDFFSSSYAHRQDGGDVLLAQVRAAIAKAEGAQP